MKRSELFSYSIKHSALYLLPLCALISLFLCCGKEEKPPEELTLKILNIDGELKPEVFIQSASEYVAAVPDLILNTSTEIITADISSDELRSHLAKTDVVIFPSLVQKKLHSLPNAFYPVSVTASELPRVLDSAYAGSAPDSYWAVPLLLDPILMVIKEQAIKNYQKNPSSWADLSGMRSLWPESKPHLLFLTGYPLSVADSLAAQQLARGYEKELIQAVPLEMDITQKEIQEVLERGFLNLKRNFFKDVDEKMMELPQVSDLSAFVESNAFYTFARRSSYVALPEFLKQQLRVRITFYNYKPTAPCYVIAAALPLDAAHPAQAEDFIQFLLDHLEEIEKAHGYHATWPQSGEKQVDQYPADTVFVPRIQSVIVGQKAVIDTFNGTMRLQELNDIWMKGLFIPSSGV